MKVAWIQDLNIWSHMGGAERTDQEIVKQGIRRGHDIDLITLDHFYMPAETDLVVFSNCHTLMYNRTDGMLKIAEENRYVCFHHDYPCKYRLFFPLKEKCKNCFYLKPWRKLYTDSILNVFMSPLHRDSFYYLMPELVNHRYILVPSAINPQDYQYKGNTHLKPRTVIGVNVLFAFKGKQNVLKYASKHPELSFTFVGGRDEDTPLPRNCIYIGPKNREELTKLYAENEYLIHLPSTPQPSERTPVEFLIANPKGKLIINHNVGIVSFDWFLTEDGKVNREKIIEEVSNSPKKFWMEIEKCIP